MYKKIVFLISLLFIGLVALREVRASEGIIEMSSTTGEPYRCWVSSILLQNGNYRMSVSCRELVYPIEEDIKKYVMWGTPIEGENMIKFGQLQFGKEAFFTRRAFSNLFITTETNPGQVKQPQGRIVMQGSVQPITFLDIPTTATPTPEEEPEEETEENGGIIEETEQPEEELTTRDKLILGLKRAGIVAFFALIALVGLIFVVTRSRG